MLLAGDRVGTASTMGPARYMLCETGRSWNAVASSPGVVSGAVLQPSPNFDVNSWSCVSL